MKSVAYQMDDFWLNVGDRVQHIRDGSWIGIVTEIDENLIPCGVTTCRVLWDGHEESDIQWTNKLTFEEAS